MEKSEKSQDREAIPLFGIPIDILSKEEVLRTVGEFLDSSTYHRIATVNPEFLLLAEKDTTFRQSLLDADLRIADGFGIILAGLLRGRCIARFPGADLMEEILAIANDRKLSVYLAIRADGLSTYDEIRSVILKKYPNITVGGADIDTESVCSMSYVGTETDIRNTRYDILFCNFGIPHQETFLAKLHDSDVRLAIGIGGSFDYLTGQLRRAPKCLRTIGLEWLWRLILQPKRFRRIWNAVIVFPMKMIFRKEKAAR
jgi:N-acetylglucosaminyldiphosphoundecaprenol N-acetyl-beta-D-mannosaminyltransferase